MNTPKREVSWLESFPPDIWAYFAWYLPGEQLGRLMMTGAKLIWRRLKSPGVVKSIKLGKDFIAFKSFPRFLSELQSIDELCIHSKNDEWIGKLGPTIDSIPSGVRKLVFSGFWKRADTLFGKEGASLKEHADTLFGKEGASLKLNEHLPYLEVLDLRYLMFADYTWLAHSPQSLTTLNISRWDGAVELPTSLVHFTAAYSQLSTSTFVSKLPPSLETFEVSRSLSGVELVVPLLPHSTRKLLVGFRASYSFNAVVSPQNLLEQLPKSLTCFQVPNTIFIDFVLNPDLMTFLPSTLIDLDISPILPCSAWRLLPPHLTKLSLNLQKESLCTVASTTTDIHGVLHEVRSIPFDSLPKSITSLELLNGYLLCGPPIHSNGSYFPPQLTQLKLDGVQLSPQTAKLLPSSLTFLQILNLSERVCEHLPSSLKTLTSSPALITPNLIKFLPKSLTCLHLQIPYPENRWFDYNTGQTIESVCELEEYSIHKRCTSPSFDWQDLSPLPSTLTELRIKNASELGDTFLRHQQLLNLIQLDLGDSKHFTDLSIPLLPPHLTALDLGSSSNISGKSFEFLPRSLTRLDLHSSASIFDSDVQHLPRTLKHAIFSDAIHLTDLCIPDLPPHLETLDMSLNSQISTASFPKFPYPLRSSQIQSSAVFSNWEVSFGATHNLPHLQPPKVSLFLSKRQKTSR